MIAIKCSGNIIRRNTFIRCRSVISLRKSGERFSGSVTAFANDFDGYIYENPTGEEEDGLPVYAFTQRDTRFHGSEAAGMLHLWETDQGHLDWTFGGTP